MTTVLAWQRAGSDDAPGVVLVHRWGAAGPATWAATGWVAAMVEAGLAVLVPDLPGHGDSADIPIPDGREPASWTAQLIQADLRTLTQGPVGVVGHADGGTTAGHLVARNPAGVTRLALISCDDRIDIPQSDVVARALRDPGARVWNPEAAELLARARRDQRHEQATLATWLERRRWPAAPNLGALRTPVLLAVGTEDDHRARVPRLAQMFHDARVVTVLGDAEQVLASPALIRQVTRFIAAG